MKNNRRLVSILLVVFIDLLGFSLILPLLPYYAKTFAATDIQIGLLVAIYAAAQLVGAPVLGRLSDRYGRRPVLLISIAGNAFGYVLLGLANSIAMLFAARLLAGITAANISVAQAYISDVTDPADRSKGLGMLGAAFGLGFIIGPALGGALSTFGYAVPAFLSAVLGAINLLLVFLWLPESLSVERRMELLQQGTRKTLSIGDMFQALRLPNVGPLLQTRLWYGLSFALLQTIFSLYTLTRFGLGAQQTGLLLAEVGVISVITQGVIVGRLTSRFTEPQLIFATTIIQAFTLLGWALAPSVVVLALILIPMAFASGVLNTVINSAISKSVPPDEVGGILGLSASLEAGTRVIAPTLGGLMLGLGGQRYGSFIGTAIPGMFSFLVMLGVIVFVRATILKRPALVSSTTFPDR